MTPEQIQARMDARAPWRPVYYNLAAGELREALEITVARISRPGGGLIPVGPTYVAYHVNGGETVEVTTLDEFAAWADVEVERVEHYELRTPSGPRLVLLLADAGDQIAVHAVARAPLPGSEAPTEEPAPEPPFEAGVPVEYATQACFADRSIALLHTPTGELRRCFPGAGEPLPPAELFAKGFPLPRDTDVRDLERRIAAGRADVWPAPDADVAADPAIDVADADPDHDPDFDDPDTGAADTDLDTDTDMSTDAGVADSGAEE